MSPIEKEEAVYRALAAYQNRLREKEVHSDLKSVCDATRFIHQHLFQPRLTVAWVREACGITSNSFPQYFKHCHQVSPHQYIQAHRIQAACRVLRQEDVDLFGLSLSLGYSRYRTFGRAFQRLMGTSPSTFREKLPNHSPDFPPQPRAQRPRETDASGAGSSEPSGGDAERSSKSSG